MKDTTLIQESQPVQVNQSSSTNNPYKYLFFTTIAILLAAVGVFYFVLNLKCFKADNKFLIGTLYTHNP